VLRVTRYVAIRAPVLTILLSLPNYYVTTYWVTLGYTTKEGNYRLVKRSELPEGATLLSSVWQMKRKRKPSTGEISKYKARMNVDGSQMIKGLHYEETYTPVVQWTTIRFFISLAILSNWHTRQLDFVLAYTQADIERDLYMKYQQDLLYQTEQLQNKTGRIMY
jgi:hypothetical protein